MNKEILRSFSFGAFVALTCCGAENSFSGLHVVEQEEKVQSNQATDGDPQPATTGESFKAIEIIGSDHFRPFATYFEIQKVIGESVATGRTKLFKKRMESFEGKLDFCLVFDANASRDEIDSVKSKLLKIDGVGESDHDAGIGKLALTKSCSF